MNRILVVTVIAFSVGIANAQDQVAIQSENYPRGPDALELLREVWDFSAENIYPETLAQRFDIEALEQLSPSRPRAGALAGGFVDDQGGGHGDVQ